MKPENSDSVTQVLPRIATHWARQTDQLLLERFGIGVAQHRILALLRPDTARSQAQLAHTLRQTEPAVSRQIALLAGRGLLISQINSQNRRQHLAMLTPKGAHLLAAVEAVLAQHTESLLARLSLKQRKQLGELLALLDISPVGTSQPT